MTHKDRRKGTEEHEYHQSEPLHVKESPDDQENELVDGRRRHCEPGQVEPGRNRKEGHTDARINYD